MEQLRNIQDSGLKSVNTGEDHMHMQIEVASNIAISDAVQKLKSGEVLG